MKVIDKILCPAKYNCRRCKNYDLGYCSKNGYIYFRNELNDSIWWLVNVVQRYELDFKKNRVFTLCPDYEKTK